MAQFVVGDIVRFHRGEYSHIALYIGNGHVIHLWSPTSGRAFSVRIDSIGHVQNAQRSAEELLLALDEDLDDDDDDGDSGAPQLFTSQYDAKMLRSHQVEPFRGDDVVRRARTRLGETRYDYLSYNCEHFVTWARYGVGASPQATSHTNQVLAGALLGAAVGGMAGLVVGGMISFFSKVNALSASSSGAPSGLEVDDANSSSSRDVSDAEEEEVNASERPQSRREARQRMLEDLSAMRLEDNGTVSEFEAWAEARHQSRMRSSARRYTDDRHIALATRLADDSLLCGICFYDLQLTRVVAFPCDHLTCAKCYDGLVTNGNGHKCCPYCRMNITDVQVIHRSTKLAARQRITSDETTTHANAAPSI